MRFIVLVLSLLVLTPAEISALEGEQATEGKTLNTLEMVPFDLSVIRKGRVRGKATIQLVLSIADAEDSQYINDRIPQIRSDFSVALASLARQRFRVNRPIDPNIVSAYLQPYLDQRLGQHKVHVYVKSATIKPD